MASSSSTNNKNICKLIDSRFEEYPQPLIHKAIKRQGYIIEELMKRDTRSFIPSKAIGLSSDWINYNINPANLEKLILLKSSHYEKRRLEKIEAVLHEIKLLLENPDLQPHRHLAAADSHKIINTNDGKDKVSNNDGDNSKSFNRLLSSSYLSAGYSAVKYRKEQCPEEEKDSNDGDSNDSENHLST